MLPFWVYMLRCSDGTFYTGHTDDLERRFAEHQSGYFRGYTCDRRPVTLVFCAEMPTRDEAIAREHQIKAWSRAKKLALIDGDWPRLREIRRQRKRW